MKSLSYEDVFWMFTKDTCVYAEETALIAYFLTLNVQRGMLWWQVVARITVELKQWWWQYIYCSFSCKMSNHREPLQRGKGDVCGSRAADCRPLPYMYVKWWLMPVCTNRFKSFTLKSRLKSCLMAGWRQITGLILNYAQFTSFLQSF